MAYQQSRQSSSHSQINHHSMPQQRTASREEFLWRRKLDLEERAFDVMADIKAFQDKLARIEKRKNELKRQLEDLKVKLQTSNVLHLLPGVAKMVPRPEPEMRLFESQIKRLLEDEAKTEDALFAAQHSLESLNAKIAHLEAEISLL